MLTIAYPAIALDTNISPGCTFPITLQGTLPVNATGVINSPCSSLFIKYAGLSLTTPITFESPLVVVVVISFAPPNTITVPGSYSVSAE